MARELNLWKKLSNKSHSLIKNRPLIAKEIGYEGDSRRICRIRMKGYKHISRLAASGEFTIDILNKIKQTPSLKLIRSIDFDP